MIAQILHALFRALIVAVLIALPALVLPGAYSDGTQVVLLASIVIGLMVFLEYNSAYPSFVEFRYAPPINRLRFFALFITVSLLTVICANKDGGGTISALVVSFARLLAQIVDFPFSPVRLMVLVLPPEAPQSVVDAVRLAASLSYAISVVILVAFVILVRIFGWPARTGAFNVWINLPLFDPTAGGDVVKRLQGHARVNLVLGFLLPFFLPAASKMASGILNPMVLANPQTLIWVVSLWAILPASLMIRGIAMQRIAAMIQQKRERAYAAAEAEGLQLA